MSKGPYRGLDWALHNPGLLDRNELIQKFLIRHELLEDLVQQIRQQPAGAGQQHIICIGQRGMGKTTLLLRLFYFVEDDPSLAKQVQPILYAEEQYNIGDLADFWLQALRHLAESKHHPDLPRRIDALFKQKLTPEGLAEAAYRELIRFSEATGKRLVLFVDNIDTILGRLDEQQAHALRQILMTDGHILIVGAAPTYFDEITDYDKPFYDFFRIYQLKGLDDQELERFLRAMAEASAGSDGQRVLAALHRHPERVKLIRRMTGGNPRIAVLIYRLLAESPEGENRRDLERLLDAVTPYYKHRIEVLPPQQQRIFDAIARNWHPVEVGALVEQLRLNSATISAQIGRLVTAGYVEPAGGTSKQKMYQVAERLYNIYYLMRFSRPGRQRLQWLVAFLNALFEQNDLHTLATDLLKRWRQEPTDNRLASLERAAYLGCIAEAIEDDAKRSSIVKDIVTFAVSQKIDDSMTDIISPEYIAGHIAGESRSAAATALREGQKFQSEGRLDEALRSFQEAVELDRTSAKGWAGLGLLYLLQRKWEDAQAMLEEAVRLDPSSSSDWNNLGISYGVQGKLEQSQIAMEKAVELAPSSAVNWQNLGFMYLRNDRLERSQLAWEKAVELDPSSAGNWQNLGLAYVKQYRVEEARSAWNRAIELDPSSAESWHNLGLSYMHQGQLEVAETFFRKAAEHDPSSANWKDLGLAYLQQGKTEEAQAVLEKAVELDTTSAANWQALGALYLKRGKMELAQKALGRSVELDPSRVKIWIALGYAFLADGKAVTASTIYERAISEHEAPELLHGLAQSLLLVGSESLDKAVNAIRQGLAQKPVDHAMLLTQALILAAQDRWKEAIDAIEGSLSRSGATYLEHEQGQFLDFFILAAAHGRAKEANAVITANRELELAERWLPLRIALEIVSDGDRGRLIKLAPEVREAVEDVLKEVADAKRGDQTLSQWLMRRLRRRWGTSDV